VPAPFGVLAERDPDRATLLPTVPLGRISGAQALALADLADRFGFDMRLTPWRGLALGRVARTAIGALSEALAALGLPIDGRSGFVGLAACAGRDGCAAAHADVRGDARCLAQELAGRAPPPGWSVDLAGCAKRCALRGGGVALIAGPDGYDVEIDGARRHTGLAPDLARAAALAAHSSGAP
jgi:sulfite reductase beta subunit-like hemoprotein